MASLTILGARSSTRPQLARAKAASSLRPHMFQPTSRSFATTSGASTNPYLAPLRMSSTSIMPFLPKARKSQVSLHAAVRSKGFAQQYRAAHFKTAAAGHTIEYTCETTISAAPGSSVRKGQSPKPSTKPPADEENSEAFFTALGTVAAVIVTYVMGGALLIGGMDRTLQWLEERKSRKRETARALAMQKERLDKKVAELLDGWPRTRADLGEQLEGITLSESLALREEYGIPKWPRYKFESGIEKFFADAVKSKEAEAYGLEDDLFKNAWNQFCNRYRPSRW
ncbi:hypothetical protein H2200_007688 [Cladophialophora chaetospira]|uniref:Uncharacterized protein n=1 Tax=Cladophialophora chaetospira TaxID=386627 RepID=A0AA38X683_9EURO|nr:hypothetical protein H2200_007688 [Cladophialophora chaetospira]